jgi:hypothetical protein
MMQKKQLLGKGNQQRCLASDDDGEVYAIDVSGFFFCLLVHETNKNQTGCC